MEDRAHKRNKHSQQHSAWQIPTSSSYSQKQPGDYQQDQQTRGTLSTNEFNSLCDCMIEFHLDHKAHYMEEIKKLWKLVAEAIGEPFGMQLQLAKNAQRVEEMIVQHREEGRKWKKARL